MVEDLGVGFRIQGLGFRFCVQEQVLNIHKPRILNPASTLQGPKTIKPNAFTWVGGGTHELIRRGAAVQSSPISCSGSEWQPLSEESKQPASAEFVFEGLSSGLLRFPFRTLRILPYPGFILRLSCSPLSWIYPGLILGYILPSSLRKGWATTLLQVEALILTHFVVISSKNALKLKSYCPQQLVFHLPKNPG